MEQAEIGTWSSGTIDSIDVQNRRSILYFIPVLTHWSAYLARISATLFLNHALEARRMIRNLLWGFAIAQSLETFMIFFFDYHRCYAGILIYACALEGQSFPAMQGNNMIYP